MSDAKKTSSNNINRPYAVTGGFQPKEPAPPPPQWFLKQASEKSGKKPT